MCRSGKPVTVEIFNSDLYLVREIGYHRFRKYGHSSDWRNVSEIKIAELFAGVGGFRLGLEGYADPYEGEIDAAKYSRAEIVDKLLFN